MIRRKDNEVKNMEEIKKETEGVVSEQRPSTKYGRTAYQQQIKEEQEKVQPNAEPSYEQNEWQKRYAGQQYQAHAVYEESKPQVKQITAWILMGIVAVSNLVNLVYNVLLSRVYSMGDTLEEIIDVTFMVSEEPVMIALSTITDILFWAAVICIILDITGLRKAGKNITGAILFAIFLRPAYFIWRAHLLGQKKLIPVIYAIAVYLIFFAQIGVILAASMEMVMRTMV